MPTDESTLRALLEPEGQDHLLQFWNTLDDAARARLAKQIESIQFDLVDSLIETWIKNEPPEEHFEVIEPVPVVPPVDPARPDAQEALAAGEDALRAGRVGLVVVAGGQGTRLGYDGPKGAYPIGPVSGRSLFAYHADKIRAIQHRYGCALPWYVMVSNANGEDTEAFFAENDYFGLDRKNVVFFTQRMMPCVDEAGKLMLDAPDALAMNPNGHGGSLLAIVEEGVAAHARELGIDTLSYIQVDNWAVKVADPYFIGYHLLRQSEFSSKVHRKTEPRESVGVHCICDGEYRVVEYSELDLYPQLLETDSAGNLLHFAGNPAIHILDLAFVERMAKAFKQFPWHRAHKKVPYVDASGQLIEPESPNAYKFETFIFDALRFVTRDPVSLEILAPGEYTPIKQYDGANSVVAAQAQQAAYWADWLEAAGCPVPRDGEGRPAVAIEISPAYALDKEEFVAKAQGRDWPESGPIAIGPDGEFIAKAP